MTNDRPPFPMQEGNGRTDAQAPQGTQPQGTQPSQSGAPQAGAPQAGAPYAPQQPQGQPQQRYDTQSPYPYGTQTGQTQAREAASVARGAYYTSEGESGWSQPRQTTQPQMAPTAAAHYAQEGAASATQTRRERRGGGVKAAVLGLLFGMIGAVGVVFAMQRAGLIGGRTVVTENAAGQTVSIATSAEDTAVARAVSEKVLPSVVSVNVTTASGSGMGSGVILDNEGNIITNNHVAGDATSISVTIDGKSYDAQLVGTDASSDLAVIKADLGDAKVTPIEIGNSDDLVVGDWVMTVGSPFGLDQSVSAGIVSSLARNTLMSSYSGNTLYANLIQVDAAINPGNSGGALVNDRGQLVGISTLYSSSTESFAGVGFAIPGNYAVDVANKIIAGETVTHAYIGLSMQTVNAQNAARNNLPVTQGAYVAEVAEGGPAADAGIEVGDIITGMDGVDITSADGMILAVRSHKIGDTVDVTLMRGKEELSVEVTLGSDEALQAQQQRLIDEQQQTQVDGLNGYTNENGTTDSYGQRDIMQELYDYLLNNRGGSYELVDDAA